MLWGSRAGPEAASSPRAAAAASAATAPAVMAPAGNPSRQVRRWSAAAAAASDLAPVAPAASAAAVGRRGRRRLQRRWRRQQWQRRRWWRVFPRPLRAGPVPCRGHQLRRRPGDDHRATGGRPGTSLAAAAERRPRRHRGSPPAPPALTAPDTSADANTSTSLCLRLRWKAGRTIKRPLGRFNPRRIQLPWTMAAPAAVAKSTRPGTA